MDVSIHGDMVISYNHEESELWIRVNTEQMPPYGSDLNADQVDLITQYIDEGVFEEPTEDPIGDLNMDSALDLVMMVDQVLAGEYESTADINGDNTLDVLGIDQMIVIILA